MTNEIINDLEYSIPKDIYGFAFVGNSSAKTLYKIRSIDACYLVINEASIDKYLEFLLHDQPNNILGLGLYNGIDQDKIRIETLTTNKFRNSYITNSGNKLRGYHLNPIITEDNNFKISTGLGNSYCNMACYKIMKLISVGQLNSRLTFLHIPKSMQYQKVSQLIDQQLIKFKKSNTKI